MTFANGFAATLIVALIAAELFHSIDGALAALVLYSAALLMRSM